ncbi:MAG: GNAT family N-acetyltransferase [Sphaerospermopsis sp. SIO1G2]|nr:GNAT family N-acetyltransferase [Sphaerospermopsis sp. SIO1G2]
MAQVKHRPYKNEHDLLAMRQFVQSCRQISGDKLSTLHVGDLSWRMGRSLDFNPQKDIHLWEHKDGRLVGFAWFTSEHNGVDIQVHPQWHTIGLEQHILQAVEAETKRQRVTPAAILRVGCYEKQFTRQRMLTKRGYTQDLFHYVHFWRPLSQPIATPQLKSGFTIRSTQPEETRARATLHNDAFLAQEVTTESYRNVMKAPDYQHELDLVVVAPNGRLAAFALCWLDPVNKVGLFEPVGTHPDFRRLGLGQAIVTAGLHALKSHGMTSAWVYTESPNLAAQRLYTSAGFAVAGKQHDYVKPLSR